MSTWYSTTITVFPIHFSRKSLNDNYLIQVLLTFEFVGAIVRHGQFGNLICIGFIHRSISPLNQLPQPSIRDHFRPRYFAHMFQFSFRCKCH